MIKMFKILYLSAITTFLMSSFWGMGSHLAYELLYLYTYQLPQINEGIYKMDQVSSIGGFNGPYGSKSEYDISVDDAELILKKITEEEYLQKDGVNVKKQVRENWSWGFDKLYFYKPEVEYYEFLLRLKLNGKEESYQLISNSRITDKEEHYYFDTFLHNLVGNQGLRFDFSSKEYITLEIKYVAYINFIKVEEI